MDINIIVIIFVIVIMLIFIMIVRNHFLLKVLVFHVRSDRRGHRARRDAEPTEPIEHGDRGP